MPSLGKRTLLPAEAHPPAFPAGPLLPPAHPSIHRSPSSHLQPPFHRSLLSPSCSSRSPEPRLSLPLRPLTSWWRGLHLESLLLHLPVEPYGSGRSEIGCLCTATDTAKTVRAAGGLLNVRPRSVFSAPRLLLPSVASGADDGPVPHPYPTFPCHLLEPPEFRDNTLVLFILLGQVFSLSFTGSFPLKCCCSLRDLSSSSSHCPSLPCCLSWESHLPGIGLCPSLAMD